MLGWLFQSVEVPMLLLIVLFITTFGGAILALFTLMVFGQKPPRNIIKFLKNKFKHKERKNKDE